MKDGNDVRERDGLVAVLRERAERPDDDVVMQALTVMGGAQAIGCGSPCADEQPSGEP